MIDSITRRHQPQHETTQFSRQVRSSAYAVRPDPLLICTGCGYCLTGKFPPHCPICKAAAERFQSLD